MGMCLPLPAAPCAKPPLNWRISEKTRRLWQDKPLREVSDDLAAHGMVLRITISKEDIRRASKRTFLEAMEEQVQNMIQDHKQLAKDLLGES